MGLAFGVVVQHVMVAPVQFANPLAPGRLVAIWLWSGAREVEDPVGKNGATSEKSLKIPFHQDRYRLEFLFGGDVYLTQPQPQNGVADFRPSNHRACGLPIDEGCDEGWLVSLEGDQ